MATVVFVLNIALLLIGWTTAETRNPTLKEWGQLANTGKISADVRVTYVQTPLPVRSVPKYLTPFNMRDAEGKPVQVEPPRSEEGLTLAYDVAEPDQLNQKTVYIDSVEVEKFETLQSVASEQISSDPRSVPASNKLDDRIVAMRQDHVHDTLIKMPEYKGLVKEPKGDPTVDYVFLNWIPNPSDTSSSISFMIVKSYKNVCFRQFATEESDPPQRDDAFPSVKVRNLKHDNGTWHAAYVPDERARAETDTKVPDKIQDDTPTASSKPSAPSKFKCPAGLTGPYILLTFYIREQVEPVPDNVADVTPTPAVNAAEDPQLPKGTAPGVAATDVKVVPPVAVSTPTTTTQTNVTNAVQNIRKLFSAKEKEPSPVKRSPVNNLDPSQKISENAESNGTQRKPAAPITSPNVAKSRLLRHFSIRNNRQRQP